MRSISDSNVTRPGRAAVLVDDERLARRRAGASRPAGRRRRSVSGTVSASRASAPASTVASPAASAFTQVGDVQDADDVVEVVAVDRQARVAAARDLRRRARRAACRPRPPTSSVRGTITWPAVRSAKPNTRWSICSSCSSSTPASWLAVTSIFSSSSECTIARPIRAAQAERRDDRLRRAVQQPDERPERAHEELGRLDDPQRRRFRRARARSTSARARRRRCATPVMTVNAIGDRDAVRRGLGDVRRQERERRLDERGERRLADPAEAEARHRDAELRGGDVAVGRR